MIKKIDGGILSPLGYRGAAVAAGLKRSKLDLALLLSDKEAVAAGAFTTNLVKAAPVVYSEELVKGGKPVRALMVNSGNANAATGEQGRGDVKASLTFAAQALQIKEEEILLCSTGVIGVPLPMDKVLGGIKECATNLGSSANALAQAILTTDTFTKEVAVEIDLGGKAVRLGGMAKGSGMIHPNMATMLAFVTTDGVVERELLQKFLNESVAESYNMISVDGDTSTNDTLLALANGASGVVIKEGSKEAQLFQEAFNYVNTQLAKMIAQDGEGATKLITVEVQGATSVEDGRTLARSIVSSNLVKTAFFGSDANWGRILCAMGYSGANFNPEKVALTYSSVVGQIEVFREGLPLLFNEERAKEILLEREITLLVELSEGSGKATAWGCDLSYDYVKINGDYRS